MTLQNYRRKIDHARELGMKDVWKDIPNYEGLYQVSHHGSVKSLDRVVCRSDGRMRRCKGKTRKLHNDNGYLTVTLSKNGIIKSHHVSVLVLSAFVSLRPIGLEACHNDGNPSNNKLTNLRWDTTKNNQADRKLHGRGNDMEANRAAKLTIRKVLEARKKYATGMYLIKELAKEYKVTPSTMHSIIRRKTWKGI